MPPTGRCGHGDHRTPTGASFTPRAPGRAEREGCGTINETSDCGGLREPSQLFASPSPVRPAFVVTFGYGRSLYWLRLKATNRIFMRFVGGAEGERFELSSDPKARNGFRDLKCLAQPCLLRPGARHNARQFSS